MTRHHASHPGPARATISCPLVPIIMSLPLPSSLTHPLTHTPARASLTHTIALHSLTPTPFLSRKLSAANDTEIEWWARHFSVVTVDAPTAYINTSDYHPMRYISSHVHQLISNPSLKNVHWMSPGKRDPSDLSRSRGDGWTRGWMRTVRREILGGWGPYRHAHPHQLP